MIIDYLTGSRADFGLMLPCLRALDESPDFHCRIVVTGQHLAPGYGDTVDDVIASGLEIVSRIPVRLTGADGAEMALALAGELEGLTRQWHHDRPDAVMLLGDRGEMLAGAIAAVHLGLPVIHVGGGELSGTLDESFRHAITKLAHVHMCTTDGSRARLVAMGEHQGSIHVVGAPGLVGINADAQPVNLGSMYRLAPSKPVALVIYHPVVQEASDAARQAGMVIDTLHDAGYGQLILRPNSDAGGAQINRLLDTLHQRPDLAIVDHLTRSAYLSALLSADLLVGNSSSGIIESASLMTPCLNIGSRQQARERNSNTIDCPELTRSALADALRKAQELKPDGRNIYGDGEADKLLLKALRQTNFSSTLLAKSNAY